MSSFESETRTDEQTEQALPEQQDQGAPGRGAAEQAPPEQGAPGATEDSGAPVGASEEAPGAEDEALRGDVHELMVVAAQRDEYLALAQRTKADFENYRKRVARDAAAASERGATKLARELLPALDNLDRALEEARSAGGEGEEGEGSDPLLDGLRLVRSQLSGALGGVGIEEFSPLGDPFDPNRHEAMAQRPVGEGEESGRVVEVYQSGYRLGESIIRPARVLVTS